MVVPTTACRRDIDARFADYHEHLILEDVCIVSAPTPWSIIYSCIKWFYKVSYPYLTLVLTGDHIRGGTYKGEPCLRRLVYTSLYRHYWRS